MKLIALTGLHGTGKDTVADALPARKLAFADVLYREVAGSWGLPESELRCRDGKERAQLRLSVANCDDRGFHEFMTCAARHPDVASWSRQARSPRQILQWWGDYRRAQDPDYFVRRTQDSVGALRECGHAIVITDCRFPNEAAMVRQLGGQIWQVVRPGHEPPRTGHASETTGDEFAPDRVLVNGGSLEELRAAALAAWEAV